MVGGRTVRPTTEEPTNPKAGSQEAVGAEAPEPVSPAADLGAGEGPAILHEWSARKVQPRVVVYVALVFVVFMALAYFVFDSMTGVKGLALASVGAIVPLIPGVLNRTEYRSTEAGIESRTLDKKNPKEFRKSFAGTSSTTSFRSGTASSSTSP